MPQLGDLVLRELRLERGLGFTAATQLLCARQDKDSGRRNGEMALPRCPLQEELQGFYLRPACGEVVLALRRRSDQACYQLLCQQAVMRCALAELVFVIACFAHPAFCLALSV